MLNMHKLYPIGFFVSKLFVSLQSKKKRVIMETIGEFVKHKRKQYALTQEDLSLKAGVGLRFLRELESGKKTLRMDKVNDVLDMFGAQLGVVTEEDEL